MSAAHIPHLDREHRIKVIITSGVIVSAIITAIIPEYQVHSVVISIATNLIWIWS